MKKDRNTFFSEYGFNNMNQRPEMMMGGSMPNNPMSNMPGNPMMGMPNPSFPNMPMPSDIDSRISKLERALNRLETRVSKLEGDGHMNLPDSDFNSSMYMV